MTKVLKDIELRHDAIIALNKQLQELHGEKCPYCLWQAGLEDNNDPFSDFGCDKCKAFVDTEGDWQQAYPPYNPDDPEINL